jgi:CheY-like chemotaxis protein
MKRGLVTAVTRTIGEQHMAAALEERRAARGHRYLGKEIDHSPKILIVDDEPYNVDILEQELAGLGYTTLSAASGQEALAKVAAENPDLILLDVMMPGMDGFTVCRLLKERKETQLIPIVFMTALGEREDRLRGIEVGGYDFFTKPPDREVLLARIQNAVAMKHAVDQLKDETAPDNTFRLDGEYWTIAYQGTVARVKDVLGLRYVAYLLSAPYRKIHVLDLVAVVEGAPEEAPKGVLEGREREAGLRISRLGHAGEQLDLKAKADYKRRLEELREELEDARECNDLGRAAKIQNEMEMLTQELRHAIGLEGRDRRAGDVAERARVNVKRAIDAALQRISSHHPALGDYLSGTINTGMYCSYTPDLDLPSPWKL